MTYYNSVFGNLRMRYCSYFSETGCEYIGRMDRYRFCCNKIFDFRDHLYSSNGIDCYVNSGTNGNIKGKIEKVDVQEKMIGKIYERNQIRL